MSSSTDHENKRTLVTRVLDRLGRAWQRFRFERVRPELAAGVIAERVEPARRFDIAGFDGFRTFLDAHARSTPAGLWDVADPVAPDALARIRRGDVELLGRQIPVDATTDWHVDPLFGVRWPRRHVASMPYVLPGSDIVVLWHLNKTMFLLGHAAAYRTTREPVLAANVYAIMDAWCVANPFMVGANWLSPMEAGTRLVVWSQTLAALRDAGVPDNPSSARITRSLIRQSDFLANHFSQWPIPNNHLIGEAAALFAFGVYWTELADSAERMNRSEQVLLHEVERQILADGFSFECSVNYHRYVLDWLLLYLHAKLLQGREPPRPIIRAATAMARAAVLLVSPSGRWPAIGDDSIDEFFALAPDGVRGERQADVRFAEMLRPQYARLLATAPWAQELLAVQSPVACSAHLAEAGITVARDPDCHLVFNHGPQHRRLFANGHMHADAGSLELELDGEPLIIDAGTYLYTHDAAVRAHFRGARAHNAPVVDGIEPMEGTGAFGWATVAKGEYLGSGAIDDLSGVGCRRRLTAAGNVPLEHTRAVVRAGDVVLIVDAIRPRPGAPAFGLTHAAVLGFRTPLRAGTAIVEGLRVRLTDGSRFVRVMQCCCDRDCHIDAIDDPADPMSGYSPRYGELRTGVTVRVAAEFETTLAIATVLRPPDVAVTPLELGGARAVFAIESAHRRRIVRVDMDPFVIAAGGYVLAGRDGNAGLAAVRRPAPASGPSDLAWLDELS